MKNSRMPWTWVSLLLLICLFIPCELSSQKCTVSGVAFLEDMADGQVALQLLDTTGFKLLNFTVTDSLGRYVIEDISRGIYSLRLAQFGYRDTVHQFVCSGGLKEFGPDVLFPLSLTLGEISVVEKAVVLQRRGDTTQVNFRILERGYEQSLTDILEAVPGLELKGNNYTFRGKNINAVLVDGLNLSDENQRNFTDGVFYKALDGIQIIENYDPSGARDLDSTTNQRAINIELTEAYRDKPQISLRAQVGYEKTYHLGANYLQVRKGQGWRIRAYSLLNDLAEQSDNYVKDYLDRILQDELFSVSHASVRPFDVNQLTQFNTPQVQNTSQQGMSFFYEAKPSDKDRRISARLSLDYTDADAKLSGFREYLDQSPSVFTVRQEELSSLDVDGKIEYQDKIGPNGQFELSVPLSFDNRQLMAASSILLVNNQSENQQQEGFGQFRVAPVYQFKWRYGSNWQCWIVGRTEQLLNDRNISISSNDSIVVPSSFSVGAERFASRQGQRYQRQLYENQARLTYKKNGWYVVTNLSSLIYRDNFSTQTTASEVLPFSGLNRWALNAYTLTTSARYDIKKFRFGGQVGGLVYQIASEGLESQRVLPAPYLFMLYKLSRKFHLSTSYSEKIELPSIEQTNNLSVQQSQVALLSGGLPLIRPTLIRSIALSLFKPVSLAEYPRLFNLSLLYRPAYLRPQLNTTLRGGFQLNQFEYIRVQREFNFNLSLGSSSRVQSFRLRLNANHRAFNQNELAIEDQHASLDVSWRLLRLGRWSTDIGGQLSVFNRMASGKTINSNINISPDFRVAYTHQRTIGEIYQQYIYNGFRSGSNRYHRVDFRLTQKKVFDKLEISLAIIDLLNFSGSEQVFNTLGQNYFESLSYQILPGRVLVGVKWYFD